MVMEITTVHYQKLVNLGEYENERVGAWANVGADETAEEAIQHLTEWVLARIDAKQEAIREERRLESDMSDKRYELSNLESDIRAAKLKWEKIVAFFQSRQIDLPKQWQGTNDIPF